MVQDVASFDVARKKLGYVDSGKISLSNGSPIVSGKVVVFAIDWSFVRTHGVMLKKMETPSRAMKIKGLASGLDSMVDLAGRRHLPRDLLFAFIFWRKPVYTQSTCEQSKLNG